MTTYKEGYEGELIKDTRYDKFQTPEIAGFHYHLQLLVPSTMIGFFWGLLLEAEEPENWEQVGSMTIEQAIQHVWEMRVLAQDEFDSVALTLENGEFLTVNNEIIIIIQA